MASLGGYINSRLSPNPSILAVTNSNPSCLVEKVLIITADSRILVGNLAGCDQSTNLVRARYPPRTIAAHDANRCRDRY